MAFDREARPARPARGNKRRKVCQFCAEKCECIDYKDAPPSCVVSFLSVPRSCPVGPPAPAPCISVS